MKRRRGLAHGAKKKTANTTSRFRNLSEGAVVMLDELAEGGVLSTALRVICNPEESRGAVEDGEYKLAVADILSIGEYHKSIFFDIYKEFESVGAMLFDYNLKIPKRRDELLQGFIHTLLISHPC